MEHRRKCLVCGKMYDYCPHCAQYSHLPTWHMMYDTEECKLIYDITEGFYFGRLDAASAYKEIKKLDWSKINIEDLTPAIQKDILKIQNTASVSNVNKIDEKDDMINDNVSKTNTPSSKRRRKKSKKSS